MTLQQTWHHWLTHQALPLWHQQGYDPAASLFHERLTFEGKAVSMEALRLMVQARQIATYCQAECDGLFSGGEQALTCLEVITRRYYHPDGQAGWAFAASVDGHYLNPLRDLYAHAFILFAHAWAYRLTRAPALLTRAKDTIADIHHLFATDNGGFLDVVPPHPLRRQNPHMHLLEAYLCLFEVSQEEIFLHHAQELVSFSLQTFYRPSSGMLLEFFTDTWSPTEPEGSNRVEPGHLFEWSWLLSEYERLSPHDTQSLQPIHHAAQALFTAGTTHGMAPPHVFDAIIEAGCPIERSLRIWPHTELMRLLARHARSMTPDSARMLNEISTDFFQHFAPATLHGGWIDRFHDDLTPAVDHMPASSLYHIYSAGREIILHHS